MVHAEELGRYIRDIPDFPKPGIRFKDITPLLAEPRAFRRAVDLLTDHYRSQAIDAVAAAEGANNAATGGAMVPMLTLGIPGSPTAAVVLGGLLIWGLQPGPLLFVEQKDFVWGLIASMYLGNIAGLIVVLTCVPLFAAILRVPFSVIAPIIMVICAIGSFTVKNAIFDVWMMVVFGILGYLFKKLDLPMAPTVLALVLGPLIERSLRTSLEISGGDPTVFFTRPISAVLLTLAAVILIGASVRMLPFQRQVAAAEEAEV